MLKTKIPMQELWLKMGGGLVHEGGVWVGFSGIKVKGLFLRKFFNHE